MAKKRTPHKERARVTDLIFSLSSSQFLYFCFSRLLHLLQSQSQSLLDVLLSVSVLFPLRSLYLPVVMAPACIYQQFSCSMMLLCLYLSKLLLHTPHWYQGRYYFPLKDKSTYDCSQGTLRPRHVSVYVDVSTLRHLRSCCHSDVHVLRGIYRWFIDSSAWKDFKCVCVHSCVFDLCSDLLTVSNGPVTTLLIRLCIFIY